MRKIIYLACSTVTAFFATSIAQARIGEPANRRVSTEAKQQSKNCELLLSIESKSTLSEYDRFVGSLVHDVIGQITDEPLRYCDEMKMAGKRETNPDKKPIQLL